MNIRSLFLLSVAVIHPGLVHAAPMIQIDARQGRYEMGRMLDILEDKDAKLSIEDILRSPAAEKFTPHMADTPNLGFSDSAFWLRTQVANTTPLRQNMILQQFSSWIDSFDLYVVRESGVIEGVKAGEKYPFAQRGILNPHFQIRMAFEPGETAWLYMRAASKDPLQLPLTLWKEDSISVENHSMALYFGVVFGCLLTVFFYNFFLFFSLRDKSYLVYVGYIACLLLMIFTYTGYSYQYLWPNSPGLNDWAVFTNGFFSMFMAVSFTKIFLGTKRILPGAHNFLSVFQAFCVLVIFAGTVVESTRLISLACVATAMIFPPMQASIGLMAYRKKVRSARFFIMGWTFSIMGIFYTMVTVMGLAESSALSRRSMEMGLVIDAILLSFALADKIKILQGEKQEAERKVTKALNVMKDELEVKVAERTRELIQSKENAEAATLLKDKFVSLISHDLRAPIGATIGLLRSVTGNDLMEPGRKVEFISRALGSCERLLKLIDQLMKLTQLKTGQLALEKKNVKARLAVEAAIDRVMPLALQKDVKINTQGLDGIMIYADQQMTEEVFQNILQNAIKFSRNNGKMNVDFHKGPPGAIVFSDDGVGIDPRILPDLFRHEVKTTTLGLAGEKGTGLGLPYCKDIMDAHGGKIWAENLPKGGCAFYVSFPSALPVIMLVDDQVAHRELYKNTILGCVKADFVEAKDGKEAMELIRLAHPDMIVTDIRMHGNDGFELLLRIKSSHDLKDIPVIVATSDMGGEEKNEEILQKAMGLGADEFVLKPISPEEFLPMAIRLLGQKISA